MAQEREKLVDLYSTYGTQVTVNEARAKVLKDRGYTTSKPRNPKLSNEPRGKQDGNSQALAEANAEIERLRAELADASAGKQSDGDFPPPADPSK